MQPSTSSSDALPGPYTILDNVLCTSPDKAVWSVTSYVSARIDSVLPFSGRVYDSNWKPLRTTVTLYRFGYRSGDKAARVVDVKATNRNGDFRSASTIRGGHSSTGREVAPPSRSSQHLHGREQTRGTSSRASPIRFWSTRSRPSSL